MATAPEELDQIARILGGEKELFHALIRPYQRAVYITAFAILKDEAEAEDAAQEAMIKAYRALAGFRGDAKFSTWLISITMNEARSKLRKLGRVHVESLDTGGGTGSQAEDAFTPAIIADWREIPSEMLEREELAQHIRQAVEDLPPAYREVFVLRDKDELSISDIAQMLGVQPNLVKVRLFRARMLLQKKLTPYLKLQLSSATKSKSRFSWMGGTR
jgi:RNA polymerase sigma-70 factor (ECF subfamily)